MGRNEGGIFLFKKLLKLKCCFVTTKIHILQDQPLYFLCYLRGFLKMAVNAKV